jgi:hypothetical protein
LGTDMMRLEKQIVMPLLQVALVGCDHLEQEQAQVILDSLRPFSEQFDEIDLATSTIMRNQKKDADSIRILKELIARNPNNWCAKSLLASLYFRMGNKDWRELTDEVLQKSSDSNALYLARLVLKEARGEMLPNEK